MTYPRSNSTIRCRAAALGFAMAAAAAAGLAACADDPAASGTLVLAIDHTSIVEMETWADETGGWAETLVDQAITARREELVLVAIGPTPAETLKVAEVDLRLECAGRLCEEDRAALIAGVGRAVREVASTPAQEPGTDLVAAVRTAADLCDAGPCDVVALTDGLDGRLFDNDLAAGGVEEAVAELTRDLGSLDGTSIRLIGVGANPNDDVDATTLARIWQTTLSEAGAADVSVTRAV